jgi:hypothetical protein
MDNESLVPLKTARIIGSILLFTIVFITSLWLGHGMGKTTRQVVLAALPASSEQAGSSNRELKHATHKLSHTKIASTDRSAARQSIPDRQRNVLLIGVDSFQAEEPRLEGVWMILYLRDTPHFMLVPVYPSQMQDEDHSALVDYNLARLFSLEDGQTPNTMFLQALRDKQLLWNGYIVLDKSALVEILAMTSFENKITSQGQQPSAINLADIEEAPMRALLEQAQLAQELCRNSGAMIVSDKNRFPGLLAQASAHIRTDLDLAELAGEVVAALRYGGGISCEFPSLATAASLH